MSVRIYAFPNLFLLFVFPSPWTLFAFSPAQVWSLPHTIFSSKYEAPAVLSTPTRFSSHLYFASFRPPAFTPYLGAFSRPEPFYLRLACSCDLPIFILNRFPFSPQPMFHWSPDLFLVVLRVGHFLSSIAFPYYHGNWVSLFLRCLLRQTRPLPYSLCWKGRILSLAIPWLWRRWRPPPYHLLHWTRTGLHILPLIFLSHTRLRD